MESVRHVNVDIRERPTPDEAGSPLAEARRELLQSRKQLRAAAAAVSEWESSRPTPRRFPIFSRNGEAGGVTAPEDAMQRLAEAQEACRVAQARVDALEMELGLEPGQEERVLA